MAKRLIIIIVLVLCLVVTESAQSIAPAREIAEEPEEPSMNLSSLSDCEEYFLEAERLYGIDASLLAAIAALESAWGTSKLAREKNNLFGYCAYDDDPNKATKFESKRESILAAAKTIKEYFDGGYNLDTIPWASDPDWAKKVRQIQEEVLGTLQ